MPHHRQSIRRNRLLRAMAPENFARLQPHLEPIALQLREVVIGADAAVDELFFLETGMVSVSTAHDERLIARVRLYAVRDWFTCSFEVTDEAGRPVMTVPFSDTVTEEDGD